MGSDEVEWVSELQNNLLLYASPSLDEELTNMKLLILMAGLKVFTA